MMLLFHLFHLDKVLTCIIGPCEIIYHTTSVINPEYHSLHVIIREKSF